MLQLTVFIECDTEQFGPCVSARWKNTLPPIFTPLAPRLSETSLQYRRKEQSYYSHFDNLTSVSSQLNYLLRTALFLASMQRVVVIRYRRFGTIYRSHLQGSRIGLLTLYDDQEWDR